MLSVFPVQVLSSCKVVIVPVKQKHFQDPLIGTDFFSLACQFCFFFLFSYYINKYLPISVCKLIHQ